MRIPAGAAFLPDDTLLLTVSDGYDYRADAQNLGTDFGSLVRLTRDCRPDARCLRTVIDADDSIRAEEFDVEAYIANVEPFLARNDFHEIEIDRRIERFGQIAHVWSLYEARPAPGSPTLLKRGANSIQLFNDGKRWWVVCTIWDNEREGVRFDLW
jgi:hypothetical protein